jgi:hypothetical protein
MLKKTLPLELTRLPDKDGLLLRPAVFPESDQDLFEVASVAGGHVPGES